MPDISTLITKSIYDTKITEIENKYVSNTGLCSKLAQANVITKINFDAKIIELENNIKKIQTFDSSYYKSKSHFQENDVQNYLLLQPMYRYLKIMFYHGYLKDYLMKVLHSHLQLIVFLVLH